MRMTLIKWTIALALVPILVFAIAACGEDDETPYRIGVMESLTGPGET